MPRFCYRSALLPPLHDLITVVIITSSLSFMCGTISHSNGEICCNFVNLPSLWGCASLFSIIREIFHALLVLVFSHLYMKFYINILNNKSMLS